jgi:two-component system, NtrC family, response regulator AtoC
MADDYLAIERTENPPSPALETPFPAMQERADKHLAFATSSPAMDAVRRQIEQVAGIHAAVLLLGESGTGKEVAARTIHRLSPRARCEFLKIGCAAQPIEVLESELFGHEARSFAGARHARTGKLEICDHGTLLLDEIASLPASTQAKLLRLLECGEFLRLGGTTTLQSDVRILATTHSDLRQAVQNGSFRADLYYRLNEFTIHMPPLRERREDLPSLLNQLMATWSASYGRPRLPITRRILDACAACSWPGNVRELENFVKRYLILGDERSAIEQLEDSGEEAPPAAAATIPLAAPAKSGAFDLKSVVRDIKKDAERAAILQALERTGGNKQKAARLLHISLRSFHYKVRAYGIESRHLSEQACVPIASAPPRSAEIPAKNCPSSPSSSPGKLVVMDRGTGSPNR